MSPYGLLESNLLPHDRITPNHVGISQLPYRVECTGYHRFQEARSQAAHHVAWHLPEARAARVLSKHNISTATLAFHQNKSASSLPIWQRHRKFHIIGTRRRCRTGLGLLYRIQKVHTVPCTFTNARLLTLVPVMPKICCALGF